MSGEKRKKMIPLAKHSKSERKIDYAAQRGSWNGLSPVTRVGPDRKSYDRNKEKDRDRKQAERGQ